MQRHFSQLGAVGIVSDIEPHTLPPNAWSDGNNMRFYNGRASTTQGHSEAFASALFAPWFLQFLRKNDTELWFYAGQNDIGAYDGSNHATVSSVSAGYSSAIALNWTSATLPGGALVLNNAVDPPQAWTGTTIANKFAALGAWPASTTCRLMASVNNFLVALDVTESGTRYPEMVRWSTRADVGSVPSSWDYADTTNQAGRTLLGASGTILDAKKLRESLAIYMDRKIYLMTEIGGQAVFDFREIFSEAGALSRNCTGDLKGQHIVFSYDDLVIHNGTEMRSIADKVVRKNLFSSIDGSNYERAFLALNLADNEAWFCYPGDGETYATIAWVWNWAENTWQKRDIPYCRHIQHGPINNNALSVINGLTGTMDALQGTINSLSAQTGAKTGLLMAGTSAGLLYQMNDTNSFNGTAYNALLERRALPLGSDDPLDLNKKKYVREVIPDIKGTVGGVVNAYVGSRDALDDATTWEGPFPYTIGTTRKLNTRVSGRVIDIRFESTTAIEWEMASYRVEYRLSGQR